MVIHRLLCFFGWHFWKEREFRHMIGEIPHYRRDCYYCKAVEWVPAWPWAASQGWRR